jgi:hypothetical protein
VSAVQLATTLDQEMIEGAGTPIASALTPTTALPTRAGRDVARELGGRFLVRYMLDRQVGRFASGSTDLHYVTPTPLSVDDVRSVLALPAATEPRRYAMLIDPSKVPEIKGPRWVRAGTGLEYLLPTGFPASAILLGWEIAIA